MCLKKPRSKSGLLGEKSEFIESFFCKISTFLTVSAWKSRRSAAEMKNECECKRQLWVAGKCCGRSWQKVATSILYVWVATKSVGHGQKVDSKSWSCCVIQWITIALSMVHVMEWISGASTLMRRWSSGMSIWVALLGLLILFHMLLLRQRVAGCRYECSIVLRFLDCIRQCELRVHWWIKLEPTFVSILFRLHTTPDTRDPYPSAMNSVESRTFRYEYFGVREYKFEL